MTTDATFRVASCTKTFTATTVLRLGEIGSLDLSDPVAQFLEDKVVVRLGLHGINLLHLLQHTSGLPDMDGDEFMNELYRHPEKVWTPWEKIERSLLGRNRTGPPGPPARYSDVGYVVLAMAIEEATKAPLRDAFRRYLRFHDLGLDVIHQEWLEETPVPAGPRVRHFVGDLDVSAIHPSCDLRGAGGLVSDAHDLAEWWHALFAGVVFDDPCSLATMLTATPEPAAGRDMGLGIYRRTVDNQHIWAHGGYWRAYPLHNQTTEATAVILLNQCLDYAGPALRDLALSLVAG